MYGMLLEHHYFHTTHTVDSLYEKQFTPTQISVAFQNCLKCKGDFEKQADDITFGLPIFPKYSENVWKKKEVKQPKGKKNQSPGN